MNENLRGGKMRLQLITLVVAGILIGCNARTDARTDSAPSASGTLLIQAAPTLNATWTLAALGDSTNVLGAGDRPVTMEIKTDSLHVAGSAGCNRYSGKFTMRADSIDFGPLVSTKMACPGWPMELETRFLSALDDAVTYAVSDSTLIFTGRSGLITRFKK